MLPYVNGSHTVSTFGRIERTFTALETVPSSVPDDQTRDQLNARTRRLHDHLEATAELPLDRTSSRWIGEAEAVARDVATNDLDAATTRNRVAKVRELLSEVGDTGDEAVDEHLEAARQCCNEVLEVEDQ